MSFPKWEKVGVIGVDSGLCWIGDPCYVLHKEHGAGKPKDIGKDRNKFCDRLCKREKSGAAQWKYDAGHAGLGVSVSTGYGDGEYDVLVRRSKGGRVAEVKVVFIDEYETDPVMTSPITIHTVTHADWCFYNRVQEDGTIAAKECSCSEVPYHLELDLSTLDRTNGGL